MIITKRPVHDRLAILSLTFAVLWFGGLGSILAVTFGTVSRRDARAEDREPSWMATSGVFWGSVGILLSAVIIIVVIVAVTKAHQQAAFG